MKRGKVLVFGAGVSGLAAARAAAEKGCECVVLEAGSEVGGLTRSIKAHVFCFDYTGHLLHLSRSETPDGLPYADLDVQEWQRIDRNAQCWVGDTLIPAPLQYNLGKLPEPYRSEYCDSYHARPSGSAAATSFRDYLVQGFGERLSEEFLIPLNEKTQAVTLDRLSSAAVKRFFPAPNVDLVRAGIDDAATQSATYNSKFWYPKEGGIEKLVHGLARPLDEIHLRQEIILFDLERQKLTTAAGDEWQWDVAFSSIPLPVLCNAANDSHLAKAGQELSWSSTLCLNLGFKGNAPSRLAGTHWAYIPDRDTPFYRIGVYSNISRSLVPPGYWSLYVEAGLTGRNDDRFGPHKHLMEQVWRCLVDQGWVEAESLACCTANIIPFAYTHCTPQSEIALPDIISRLQAHNIHLIGRYGRWDYTSMEDAIYQSRDLVREVL